MKIARPSASTGFLAIAACCVAAVAGALVGQHVFDMQPCPWCVLQRVIFLAIAALALLAWAPMNWGGVIGRVTRLATGVLTAALGLAGAAAAAYQNLVAAKLPSCDLTLADRIVSTLGLDRWQPEVFEVRASCAEAAVKLLGVPFELWSLALFLLLAGAGLWLASRDQAG